MLHEHAEFFKGSLVEKDVYPRFLAIIERSRARQKAEGGLSSDEMRRRLGLRPKPRGNGR